VGALAKGERTHWTPPCNCPLNRGKETHWFSVWGLEFHFNQQLVPHHREGCKFHGIGRKPKKTLQAWVPVMFGQFLGRFNRACVEYTTGAGCPGISLRFINIVPRKRSPVVRLLAQMSGDRFSTALSDKSTYLPPLDCLSQKELVSRLEMIETAVISLYRDRMSAPWDLTEDGSGHETVTTTLSSTSASRY